MIYPPFIVREETMALIHFMHRHKIPAFSLLIKVKVHLYRYLLTNNEVVIKFSHLYANNLSKYFGKNFNDPKTVNR